MNDALRVNLIIAILAGHTVESSTLVRIQFDRLPTLPQMVKPQVDIVLCCRGKSFGPTRLLRVESGALTRVRRRFR